MPRDLGSEFRGWHREVQRWMSTYLGTLVFAMDKVRAVLSRNYSDIYEPRLGCRILVYHNTAIRLDMLLLV
jgi:hypothetical protein